MTFWRSSFETIGAGPFVGGPGRAWTGLSHLCERPPYLRRGEDLKIAGKRAADNAAARDAKRNRAGLSIEQRDRAARASWTFRAVVRRDVAVLRRRQGVTPGGQVFAGEHAIIVGDHRAAETKVGAVQRDAHTAYGFRPAFVRNDDPSHARTAFSESAHTIARLLRDRRARHAHARDQDQQSVHRMICVRRSCAR